MSLHKFPLPALNSQMLTSLPASDILWSKFFGELDHVWYDAQLYKLPAIRLHPELPLCIESFLMGRGIQKVVEGIHSETQPNNAGVSQSCILSTRLFLLQVSDT